MSVFGSVSVAILCLQNSLVNFGNSQQTVYLREENEAPQTEENIQQTTINSDFSSPF